MTTNKKTYPKTSTDTNHLQHTWDQSQLNVLHSLRQSPNWQTVKSAQQYVHIEITQLT